MTGDNYYAVHSELRNLESLGLSTREKKGKQVYYSVNQDFLLYHELQQMVLKTEGVSSAIRERVGNLQKISCMFIIGSFAAGTAGKESDIDLFIVGDVGDDAVITAVHEAEKTLGREINYTLMSDREYLERKERNDPFVMNILNEPRVILVGCND
jgi:predicted nucleotidyltransferase